MDRSLGIHHQDKENISAMQKKAAIKETWQKEGEEYVKVSSRRKKAKIKKTWQEEREEYVRVSAKRRRAKIKKTWQEEGEEYVKSAAWAWYLHGSVSSCKFVRESDAHAAIGGRGAAGPSRFKLEAMGLINNNYSLQQNRFSVLKTGKNSNSADGLGNIFSDENDLVIESHQSSLLDPYEMEALSRQLQTTFFGATLPAEKSSECNGKSFMYRGISGADVSKSNYKNGASNSPRARLTSLVKSRWMPIMCSLTDVVIPGPDTPIRSQQPYK